MKRNLLRCISAILCISILLSVVTVTSFAKEGEGEKTVSDTADLSPVIIIPGIGMSRTTLFDDNGDIAKKKDGSNFDTWEVFNFYLYELLWNLWKIVPVLLISLVLQHDVGLTKVLEKQVPSLFKYSMHDKEGKSVENVKALAYNYPLSQYDKDAKDFFYKRLPIQEYAQIIGEEKIYVYNFAAFSNTYDEAEGLHNFIQMVKEQHPGHDKVTLVPVSLGGTVANAYFDMYKDERDVDRVINVVAALDGSQLVADLFMLNFGDNAPELLYRSLLPVIAGKSEGYLGYIGNIVLRLIPRGFARKLVDVVLGSVVNSFVRNVPSLWALVPHDRYEEIADKYLVGDEYKVLRAQTDRYHNAQANLEERVKELAEDYGIEIYNVGGCDLEFGTGWESDYNYFQFFKCSKGSNSDGIIQVSSTAMGTDSVSSGETYNKSTPDGTVYCTDPTHDHIEGSINAATCYRPEHTWYFLGQHHEIAYNDVAVEVVCKILVGEIQDIYSDPAYPQFNGTRLVKKIVREYLPDFKEIDRTKLTEDQIKVLDAAVEKTEAMLASTVADDSVRAEAEKDLYDALVYCGVYEKQEEEKFKEFMGNVLYKMSEGLYKLVGPRGFFDVITFKYY